MDKSKRGRKPLNLTPEERRVHNAYLQRMRTHKKKEAEQHRLFENITMKIIDWYQQDITINNIAERLVQDPHWSIKYNPNATSLSGAGNGRVKRHIDE